MANKIYESTLEMDVCIVGGGIGGLAAGLSLQKIGCSVKVYERDNDFVDRKQGYGLTLTNNIKGPLAQLGVLDECIEQNCLSKSHYVFTESGNVLGYYGRALISNGELAPSSENFSPTLERKVIDSENKGNLRIPRQDLREMMMRRLSPDTLRWSRKLVQYTEYPTHVRAEFECRDPVSGETATEFVNCAVLVGADGVRSVVRRLRDAKEKTESVSPLTYLGVAVIIGLSTLSHPLLNSRGFYVLDGTHRMFTMPFTDPEPNEESDNNTVSADSASGAMNTNSNHGSSQKSNQNCNAQSQRQHKGSLTMWQLSFSGLTEQEAVALRTMPFNDLIAEALRRTEGWFAPVQDMIRSTAHGEIWGTPLYDRDAMKLKAKHQGSRVTVLGDACHPMSMFKGQGANMALDDGPLLAHWLGRNVQLAKNKRKRDVGAPGSILPENATSNSITAPDDNVASDASGGSIFSEPNLDPNVLYTRLRCFEREMVARASSKAEGSRNAAHHLHSVAALSDVYTIEGVNTSVQTERGLVNKLREENVTAALSDRLDGAMKESLSEFIENIKGQFC